MLRLPPRPGPVPQGGQLPEDGGLRQDARLPAGEADLDAILGAVFNRLVLPDARGLVWGRRPAAVARVEFPVAGGRDELDRDLLHGHADERLDRENPANSPGPGRIQDPRPGKRAFRPGNNGRPRVLACLLVDVPKEDFSADLSVWLLRAQRVDLKSKQVVATSVSEWTPFERALYSLALAATRRLCSPAREPQG